MRKAFEWCFVAVVIASLGTCGWFVVARIEKPDGPIGEPVPRQLPNEANRIHHPSGISIVLPPNWLLDRPWESSTDRFAAHPRGYPGRRVKALLHISFHSREPAGAKNLAPVSFQGQPARERMVVERRDTFDDPPWSMYSLLVKRNERFYWIEYGVNEERTELPPIMRKYLETLVFDDPP